MELRNRPSAIREIGKCVTLLCRALLCSGMESISTSPDWIAMFNISVGALNKAGTNLSWFVGGSREVTQLRTRGDTCH